MIKYTIRSDMGFCGTETDFCEIEIPDDEDPETSPEIQEALAEALAAAVNDISVWYELADEE